MAKKKKARTRRKRTTKRATTYASASEPAFTAHFRPTSPAKATAARKMLTAVGLEPILTTASGALVVRATRSQIEQLTASGIKEKTVPRAVNHAQGYAMDDEEYEEGVRCIAAPVRDYTGNVVAAISISGPAMRMMDKKMVDDLVLAVKDAGEEVSRRLGYNIGLELAT